MIPGPHCAAQPYQVYLISGIARWNSDRSLDAVFGGRSRHNRVYSAPLIDRLNSRCQQLFGETVEENFRAPANIQLDELLRLEYLFNQSTGESFSLEGIVNDGPGLKFSKRYSAAHLVDSRKNQLMYCIIKQLWLHPDCGGKARGSPLKHQITKMYQRVQQRETVDDAELSKLSTPILKINSKCVSEFIRRACQLQM